MANDVEQVTGPLAFHAEGPVWDESFGPGGTLRYVDLYAGDILTLQPDATVTRLHVGTYAAAFRPRAGGGMAVGIDRGFLLVDPDGTSHRLADLWADEKIRMNDGSCDPDGRFYCGSMSPSPGGAALYRLDPDGTTTRVFGDVTTSNGLEWSPDGALAYYNDTPTGRVSVFDYDPQRGLTGRRTLADAGGRPDGLTVDADGYVWVALWGGSAVHRYAPDGRLDGVVELPVTNVSACTFGGPDRDELFITTSREHLPAGTQPEAGSIFRARPGVTGRPARRFAG